tara:strand:+ start:42 stop:320 length:279 start_codon:yes stop_codon:yes gene_type:complete
MDIKTIKHLKKMSTKIKKDYLKLLERYHLAIENIYLLTSNKDFTPDYMRYDYDGFDDVNTDEKEYIEQLKKAVKKAELYVKYLQNNYKYTFQ